MYIYIGIFLNKQILLLKDLSPLFFPSAPAPVIRSLDLEKVGAALAPVSLAARKVCRDPKVDVADFEGHSLHPLFQRVKMICM